MESKVVRKPESQVEVVVTFTSEEWAKEQEKAFKKLAENVTVKGFRKGKAPENLARKEIGQEKIFQEALRYAVEGAYIKVINEHELIPLVQPTFDVQKLSDTELEIVYKLIVAPEIKLGAYKDLEIGHEEVSVDENAIDMRLHQLLEQNANLVLKEGEAELGDTVVIDFEGFIDEKAFEGGKAENFSLELGSGQFVPGFEEQLVGKKAEDEVDVKVTFPEQYVEELAGKDAVFKVKVHEVKVKEVPEADDEFAKELNIPNVTNLVELRMHLFEEIDHRLHEEEKQRYIDKVLANVRENSEITLAPQIVDNEVEYMKNTLTSQLAQQGLDLETYLKTTGQTEEELEKQMREDAKKNIDNYLIINEIGKREEINVTDEILDFEIAKMAMQYKMEEAQIRELLGENIERLHDDIRRKMIFDVLANNNN
ncbi:MAG: trigger factor [Bacilli bacterium]|jgi:trigger factor